MTSLGIELNEKRTGVRGCVRKAASLEKQDGEARAKPRSFSLFNGRPSRVLQKSMRTLRKLR